MKKVVFPLNTGTAVVCVAMAGMWLSNASVAGIVKFGSGGDSFDMTFVPIGNANNADDMTGAPTTAGKPTRWGSSKSAATWSARRLRKAAWELRWGT